MFYLLKNKQKPVIEANDRDRMAKAIVVKVIRLQQQWAAFMQRYFERLTGKWKIITLTLFCLCAGGCSLYLIAKSLSGNYTSSFGLNQNKHTLNVGKGEDKKGRIDEIIAKKQYNKIEHFKRYMDSLARSPSGKAVYDNILVCHPSLLDSLALFENIYQKQNKK